jgi:hypothetical protein
LETTSDHESLDLSLAALKAFLVEAKRRTFAGEVRRSTPLRPPYSRNYEYDSDGFRYEDQYFGEHVDVGQEIVWFKGFPIWGMGYRGGMMPEFMSIRGPAFAFLREALRNPDPELPLRGPHSYAGDTFVYTNAVDGDITAFTGDERVTRGNDLVCFRKYVGGLIAGKFVPLRLT